MAAAATPPVRLGSIVRLPDVTVEGAFLEGVVGDVAFDGVATVTVMFPATAARTVTMDQVVAVGADTPTPLRTFMAAIQAAAPVWHPMIPTPSPHGWGTDLTLCLQAFHSCL